MINSLFSAGRIKLLFLLAMVLLSVRSDAQKATNSVFVNFGRLSCNDSYWGSDITLISDAQSTNPGLLLQCNTTVEIGNVFSKFISYNAINNKLYINDISDYVNSKIYILPFGTPSNITCPTITGPSYTIPNVILNQFEFDPIGDLYAISNYDASTGLGNIGAYDDTTGLLQTGSLKTLTFPAGNAPVDILNGDLAIIPNGRMFCVFGGGPSRLYEILNYKKTAIGNATTVFLGEPTNVCYGLAYDNGYLLMGGTDLAGYCWAFYYDFLNSTLSPEIPAPLNCMPIDDNSFTPAIGIGEKLVNSVQLDANHYEITYQIYVRNMGNVKIGNVQIKNDMGSLFGAANVSDVQLSFISNAAGLSLNPLYDGTTNTNLLLASQQMNNTPALKTISVIQLKLTVANAIPLHVYYNSTVFSGKIGKDSTLLSLKDSSNNYLSSLGSWPVVVDPNANNKADDVGEGKPTPWSIGIILPIQLSAFDVEPLDEGASVTWTTLSEIESRYFAIERSIDAVVFDSVGIVAGMGSSSTQHDYSFHDKHPPRGVIYYRLRKVDLDGSADYSEIKALKLDPKPPVYSVYPNPASGYLIFESSDNTEGDLTVELYDLYGARILSNSISGAVVREKILLPPLPDSYYMLRIKNSAGSVEFLQVFIHK